ncbi:hypothetical protein DL96DRAFT_720404 [Flagelloscypha sp. PMI_526]|nr:hypothetical protein DL96DRAFT_720404 [Flagelloscypha sp. PMI_526]
MAFTSNNTSPSMPAKSSTFLFDPFSIDERYPNTVYTTLQTCSNSNSPMASMGSFTPTLTTPSDSPLASPFPRFKSLPRSGETETHRATTTQGQTYAGPIRIQPCSRLNQWLSRDQIEALDHCEDAPTEMNIYENSVSSVSRQVHETSCRVSPVLSQLHVEDPVVFDQVRDSPGVSAHSSPQNVDNAYLSPWLAESSARLRDDDDVSTCSNASPPRIRLHAESKLAQRLSRSRVEEIERGIVLEDRPWSPRPPYGVLYEDGVPVNSTLFARLDEIEDVRMSVPPLEDMSFNPFEDITPPQLMSFATPLLFDVDEAGPPVINPSAQYTWGSVYDPSDPFLWSPESEAIITPPNLTFDPFNDHELELAVPVDATTQASLSSDVSIDYLISQPQMVVNAGSPPRDATAAPNAFSLQDAALAAQQKHLNRKEVKETGGRTDPRARMAHPMPHRLIGIGVWDGVLELFERLVEVA